MTRTGRIFVWILALCLVSHAAVPQQEKSAGKIQLSSPVQAYDPEVIRAMAKQEAPLENIKLQIAALDRSVDNFKRDLQKQLDDIKDNLKSLNETKTVMNFIIGIVKWGLTLSIPTVIGIWFTNRLKRGPLFSGSK